MSKIYHEAEAYASFKKVRNKLRRYYPDRLILKCIEALNNKKLSKIQSIRQYPPWFFFLIIKWTALYGEFLSPDRKEMTDSDFNNIINLMHDLNGKMRLPNQYDNFFLFFRNLAFQQFWFNENLSIAKIARQSLLFDKLAKEHLFRKMFERIFGISIKEFIEIEIMILTKYLTTDEIHITADWYQLIKEFYPKNTLKKILEYLSLNPDELVVFFKEIEKLKVQNVSYEFFEQTPLKKHPFLKLNDSYLCFSRHLLYQSMQDIIYEVLRTENPEKFMNKFGRIFENYVLKILQYSEFTYLEEKEIKSIIKLQSKTVDFLIFSEDINLLVDAKGVEMAYLGMVSHKPEVISDKTKSSVIKGIKQGYETVNNLNKVGHPRFSQSNSMNNYLFIVTYRDLFLGNGTDFFEYIAKDRLKSIIEENENYAWIPFENMYFISIDDFESFVQLITTEKLSLTEVLKKIIKNDSKPETKKLILRQHLNELSNSDLIPDFVKKEFDLFFRNLEEKLKKVENSNGI